MYFLKSSYLFSFVFHVEKFEWQFFRFIKTIYITCKFEIIVVQKKLIKRNWYAWRYAGFKNLKLVLDSEQFFTSYPFTTAQVLITGITSTFFVDMLTNKYYYYIYLKWREQTLELQQVKGTPISSEMVKSGCVRVQMKIIQFTCIYSL